MHCQWRPFSKGKDHVPKKNFLLSSHVIKTLYQGQIADIDLNLYIYQFTPDLQKVFTFFTIKLSYWTAGMWSLSIKIKLPKICLENFLKYCRFDLDLLIKSFLSLLWPDFLQPILTNTNTLLLCIGDGKIYQKIKQKNRKAVSDLKDTCPKALKQKY